MTPFMKIDKACAVTGLSRFYLRQGCKNGSIPHVMNGKVYMINVPALLEQLGVNASFIQSTENRTPKTDSKHMR